MSTQRQYEGRPDDYRLTPDILAGDTPYTLTRRRYDLHLRMLEDIDAGEGWRWTDRLYSDRAGYRLDEDERQMWYAIFNSGLVRKVDYRPGYVLTRYGELYLDQRRQPGGTEARGPVRDPTSKTYRGWTIAPHEGTQIGHKLPASRQLRQQLGLGTHRKSRGYVVQSPPDEAGYVRTKIVSTLREARAYIDDYEGPAT